MIPIITSAVTSRITAFLGHGEIRKHKQTPTINPPPQLRGRGAGEFLPIPFATYVLLDQEQTPRSEHLGCKGESLWASETVFRRVSLAGGAKSQTCTAFSSTPSGSLAPGRGVSTEVCMMALVSRSYSVVIDSILAKCVAITDASTISRLGSRALTPLPGVCSRQAF